MIDVRIHGASFSRLVPLGHRVTQLNLEWRAAVEDQARLHRKGFASVGIQNDPKLGRVSCGQRFPVGRAPCVTHITCPTL
ncbi:hypothetical protein [Caballeronia sp. dw_276]|uniref:hypothetical protein n=1 Tax=Caballeronia sp. dw_276 TaxID=2719795 RepID=UPI001BD61A69|nr:hypothetical protein [Caballeronia sp. dw_276]